MNMISINADGLKIRDRARVEAGTANTLTDHEFSKAHAEVFVAIAYDTFHEVKNYVPANAQVLTDFLLKDKAGRDMMKEAKAIIASNRTPAPIPVLDIDAPEPVVTDNVARVMPNDVFARLTARVKEAFDDYLASGNHHTTRKPLYVESALMEVANACAVYGLNEFQMPCKDWTDMSREYFFQHKDAVNSRKIPMSFTLKWQPGGIAPPRKDKTKPARAHAT